MLNTSSANVPSGKLPLWTFVLFGITLLLAVGCTWLITWKSCAYSSQHVDNTLEKSLQSCRVYINGSIRDVNHELQQKQYDPATKEKTSIWKPKSDTAIFLMNRLNEYMSTLKQKLKLGNSLEANERHQLLDSVRVYYTTVTSAIPKDKQESLGTLPILQLIAPSNKADSWLELFQTENSPNVLSALLTKLQFESSASAYIVTDFCNQQTHYIDEGYDVFDVLIGQNAQQLLPNKTLRITAGVGTYSSRAKPEIIIDDIKQDLNANGFVVFEKRVNKSGSVPVSVSYKDPNTGEQKKISTNVEYAVAKY